MGMFVSEDIDQRLFMWNWDKVFGILDHSGKESRHSIQFFDRAGTAILKIYETRYSVVAGFQSIFAEFKSEDQRPEEEVICQNPQPQEPLPDEAIDQESFRDSWLKMRHTHEFHGLLKKYQVTRTQALRLAPYGTYATPVNHAAIRTTLEKARDAQVPIMAFVGNDGLIQIHSGPVKKLMEYHQWYNVMDPNFNLHLHEAGIEQVWVVRKPSDNGIITSLEVFNHQKGLVLTLFGERKANAEELPQWTRLMKVVEEFHAY
jgi:putative hemin transport protein